MPNSVVYWLANNPEMPNVVAAASLFGYVYVSEDGGNTWSKLQKEFGEIRALAVTPKLTPDHAQAPHTPNTRRGGFKTRPSCVEGNIGNSFDRRLSCLL